MRALLRSCYRYVTPPVNAALTTASAAPARRGPAGGLCHGGELQPHRFCLRHGRRATRRAARAQRGDPARQPGLAVAQLPCRSRPPGRRAPVRLPERAGLHRAAPAPVSPVLEHRRARLRRSRGPHQRARQPENLLANHAQRPRPLRRRRRATGVRVYRSRRTRRGVQQRAETPRPLGWRVAPPLASGAGQWGQQRLQLGHDRGRGLGAGDDIRHGT